MSFITQDLIFVTSDKTKVNTFDVAEYKRKDSGKTIHVSMVKMLKTLQQIISGLMI